jgi:anaerobic magnesium-protoporphyrin IX monomethyl ester cyclase
MTSITLLYPYFKPRGDRSVFRFPPLGIGYIASTLKAAGHDVYVLDCTFLKKKDALEKTLAVKTSITGIYCMASIMDDCFWFAERMRSFSKLLVAGGPMPTCDPSLFLEHFDVVVRGEGEQTMLELIRAFEEGSGMERVPGIVFKKKTDPRAGSKEMTSSTAPRPFTPDLDRIPFPARAMLPNQSYINYGRRTYGFSITTVMSTRGCPFQCEFCSNVVFGGSYRERSPRNVVDEIEEALKLGYDRISFADDVFTMNPERVKIICEEIRTRGLHFQWECLGRVDTLDYPLAVAMKNAGCMRIFFGIESGSESILKLMNKKITTDQARGAVEAASRAGLQVGAFFILFYPGDTNDTVLQTLRFALSLPVNYLGLTMPYALPGTDLYKRVYGGQEDGRAGGQIRPLIKDFSITKMRFGILKGKIHFALKRKLGRLAPSFLKPFETVTDALFRRLK